MMTKTKVLFVCIHNSARSQMAEAFLKQLGADKYEVRSAGLEPGKLNPVVVEVMLEAGIDISKQSTTGVTELLEKGVNFDIVITVCDEASAERCPVFPGQLQRIAWSFPDPSAFNGSSDDVLAQTRVVRDQIKQQVEAFLQQEPNN